MFCDLSMFYPGSFGQKLFRLLALVIVPIFLFGSFAKADSFDPYATPSKQYRPLTQIIDLDQLFISQDTEHFKVQILRLSSLTTQYHKDLLNLLDQVPTLDKAHLELFLDLPYFTFEKITLIQSQIQKLGECQDIECDIKLKTLKQNLNQALTFKDSANAVTAKALSKWDLPNPNLAFLYFNQFIPSPGPTETDSALEAVFPKLNLDQKQLLSLLDLSLSKKCTRASFAIAQEWFLKFSDQSFETWIKLLNYFPAGQGRDLLINAFYQNYGLTEDQIIGLFAMSTNTESFAYGLVQRLRLSGWDDFFQFLQKIDSGQIRGQIATAAFDLFRPMPLSVGKAQALLRLARSEQAKLGKQIFSVMSKIEYQDFILLTNLIPAGAERDGFILAGINSIPELDLDQTSAIILLSSVQNAQIAQVLMGKIRPTNASQIARISGLIGFGPARDQVILAGSNTVKFVSANALGQLLKQSYKDTVQIAKIYYTKMVNTDSADLAMAAQSVKDLDLRDKVFIQLIPLTQNFSDQGCIDIMLEAGESKTKIAPLLIDKLSPLSAQTLASIVGAIQDGDQRDLVITYSLPKLQGISANGLALLLTKAFQKKGEFGMILLPRVLGLDAHGLFIILKACGSGSVRDQLLAKGLDLLPGIPKKEAGPLAGQAYRNKEKVALTLLQKVIDLDAITIAEVASTSSNPMVRDHIIAAGIKLVTVIDKVGLIALIRAADKIAESLALDGIKKVHALLPEDAVEIARIFASPNIRDRLLILAMQYVIEVDEPSITLLSVNASSQDAKDEILRIGLERMGAEE